MTEHPRQRSGRSITPRIAGAIVAKPVAARRRPHQLRSERRVREILDVTARLLEEVGPNNLTTNRVAERLGVSVGTLYHYFPNKHAILYVLGVNWLNEWQKAFDEMEQFSHTESGIAGFVDRAIDRMLKVYQEQHGILHLVQAMFTIPELRELDTRQDEVAVERLSIMFRRLGVAGTAGERGRLARVYFKLSNSLLLEAVSQTGSNAAHTLEDLKALLRHHLTRRR